MPGPRCRLHDGFVCGVWHMEPDALVVEHAMALTKRVKSALAAEGRRFLRYVAAGADTSEIRFVRVR